MNHYMNTKVIFVIMLAGTFWWIFSGHKMITTTPDFEEFIENYRGAGFFSLDTLILVITCLSVIIYPAIIWMLVCIEIIDRGSIKELLFSGESWPWFLWLAPFTLLLFILLMFFLKVVTSVAGWALFISMPIILLIKWIRNGF